MGTEPSVVVVGGGYGGITVAKALDAIMDVTLVEPKDAFFHNVAALRALVEPAWRERVFYPYDRLLTRGHVLRDRASRVEPGRVTTAGGEVVAADFVVLATGSSYPFPAKADDAAVADAHRRFADAHAALSGARRVLLLGAGPVGIELAGEITHAWPDKAVTILDPSPDLLAGPFLPELRAELRRQLTDRAVRLVLGQRLITSPPVPVGELAPFTVTTDGGEGLAADLWFQCYGVVPNSDFLAGTLADARRPDGFIEVGPTLQVAGQERVFAIGDVSDADAKMAGFAARQAETVVTNLTALADGQGPLVTYEPIGPAIAVPVGPEGGAGQFPGQDGIVGAEVVAEVKGRHMMVDRFADLLGSPGISEASVPAP